MSASVQRSSVFRWIYNHNPFYVISAVLILYSVYATYGEIEIGKINCWVMTGVLAGYTLVLATIGILIVRYGKVWEDARSILLILLLLFLGVSVGADHLFVTVESSAAGAALLLCGFVFSSVVSEVVLRGTGVRLPWLYRLPYHLLLALFYVAPWWCSPQMHSRSVEELEWAILLFPLVAAVLLMLLLPAARRGPEYVKQNGTPWGWPLFPWTAFGVIIVAIGLRSFVLAMAFGPSGPMWIELRGGDRLISFDTMWGMYFLIPPALATLLLILEGGLATDNRNVLNGTLTWAPILLLLSGPWSSGPTFRGFYGQVTQTFASPIWLTICGVLAFYSWAAIRRVQGAAIGLAAMSLLLCVVGPETVNTRSMTDLQPWPLIVIGIIVSLFGVRRRESLSVLTGGAMVLLGAWYLAGEWEFGRYRNVATVHLAGALVVVVGLFLDDRLAKFLRITGAGLFPAASLGVMTTEVASGIAWPWILLYVATLTALAWGLARTFQNEWYMKAFLAQSFLSVYGVLMIGFRQAVLLVGRQAVTAFAWSVGTLLLGILISAHKAKWLPKRMMTHIVSDESPDESGTPNR